MALPTHTRCFGSPFPAGANTSSTTRLRTVRSTTRTSTTCPKAITSHWAIIGTNRQTVGCLDESGLSLLKISWVVLRWCLFRLMARRSPGSFGHGPEPSGFRESAPGCEHAGTFGRGARAGPFLPEFCAPRRPLAAVTGTGLSSSGSSGLNFWATGFWACW